MGQTGSRYASAACNGCAEQRAREKQTERRREKAKRSTDFMPPFVSIALFFTLCVCCAKVSGIGYRTAQASLSRTMHNFPLPPLPLLNSSRRRRRRRLQPLLVRVSCCLLQTAANFVVTNADSHPHHPLLCYQPLF